jgi:hypothetical protein
VTGFEATDLYTEQRNPKGAARPTKEQSKLSIPLRSPNNPFTISKDKLYFVRLNSKYVNLRGRVCAADIVVKQPQNIKYVAVFLRASDT